MATATIQQARNRIKTLPSVLRDALFSIQTAEIIRAVTEKNHIPPEKNSLVAQAIGLVLLGFVHLEDLAKEIETAAGLSSQTASSISNDVAARLLNALKNELDKAYAPLPHLHEEISMAPKILQEINPAAPAPRIISPAATGGPVVSATPLATNQEKAAPPPVPPAPISLGQPKPAAPPSPPSPPLSQAPKPGAPEVGWSKIAPPFSATGPLGEFERLNKQQGAPAPKPPGSPAEPAPVIIHEDSSRPQQQRTPDFRLQLPVEGFGNRTGPPVPSVKPALLELGKASPPPAPPKPPGAVPNVVHYTEYKPSSSGTVSTPGASKPTPSAPPQGPRQITEVTLPSASPQNKVVYKDYTEPPPQVSKAPPPSPSPLPPPPPPPKS